MIERPDLRQTFGRLLGPEGPEVGCDACFDELDRYVELEVAGADADAAIPGCGRISMAALLAARSTTASMRSSAAISALTPTRAPFRLRRRARGGTCAAPR
jgi:hypothetical protein